MGSTSSERQYSYRMKHPQLNVTFRDYDEYLTMQKALRRTACTTREVLLNWAQHVLAESQPSERAGKPNAGNSSNHDPVIGIV